MFLRYVPSALPYAMSPGEDVLILDPKGGLQVLMAREYGSRRIYKVESTPNLIDTIKRESGKFLGRYLRPANLVEARPVVAVFSEKRI